MLTISPAVAADIPQLAGLLGLLFAQEADFSPDHARQERALGLLLADPRQGALFAAHAQGELVGMVSLLFTISTAAGGPACWLEDLVVRADRRRQGIGARLLTQAVAAARARGCLRMSLLTDQVNADAQRFYARHGFATSAMMAMRLTLDAAPGAPSAGGAPPTMTNR